MDPYGRLGQVAVEYRGKTNNLQLGGVSDRGGQSGRAVRGAEEKVWCGVGCAGAR